MSPKLAQDERKRIIPRWQLVDLHPDGYESVVDDGAVTKIDFVAFAGFLDFVGEGLCVAVAGLEIGLCGLGISESGHDEFPYSGVGEKDLDGLEPAEPVFWAGHIDFGAMGHQDFTCRKIECGVGFRAFGHHFLSFQGCLANCP